MNSEDAEASNEIGIVDQNSGDIAMNIIQSMSVDQRQAFNVLGIDTERMFPL